MPVLKYGPPDNRVLARQVLALLVDPEIWLPQGQDSKSSMDLAGWAIQISQLCSQRLFKARRHLSSRETCLTSTRPIGRSWDMATVGSRRIVLLWIKLGRAT